MIRIQTTDDSRNYLALTAQGREPGIATARYAAAMHFYFRGMISAETLEAYRTCSPLDGEDPRGLLAARGLLTDIQLAKES